MRLDLMALNYRVNPKSHPEILPILSQYLGYNGDDSAFAHLIKAGLPATISDAPSYRLVSPADSLRAAPIRFVHSLIGTQP